MMWKSSATVKFVLDADRWPLYRLMLGIRRPDDCFERERHRVVGHRCVCGFIRYSSRRVRWL